MTTRIHPDKAARRPHVPEEGRALDRAIALLNGSNPLDYVAVSKKGKFKTPKNALGAAYKVVYIRSNGWTFAAPEKWRVVAEDQYKGDWIGRLEFSRVVMFNQTKRNKKGIWVTLFVISQQGFEYEAAVLDMEGNVRKGVHPDKQNLLPPIPPIESQDGEPSGGRSLEQMRNWLAAGCPEENE